MSSPIEHIFTDKTNDKNLISKVKLVKHFDLIDMYLDVDIEKQSEIQNFLFSKGKLVIKEDQQLRLFFQRENHHVEIQQLIEQLLAAHYISPSLAEQVTKFYNATTQETFNRFFKANSGMVQSHVLLIEGDEHMMPMKRLA